MAITPTSIDFGDTDNEKNITIKNTGNAPLTWNISGITEESISVSETEGTVESEGSKVIKVKLDRTKLNNNLNTSFVISDGIKEQTVTVKATKVEENAEMKIEPTLLDFGHSSTELSLTVSNTGKAELKYTVSGISTYKGQKQEATRIVVKEEGQGNDLVKYFVNANVEVDSELVGDGCDIKIIVGYSED